MKIKFVVCTHKKYDKPQDLIYHTVQSGSAIYPYLGYQIDDEDENI